MDVLQILNAAAQRAYVNFQNHVATNFFPRTMRFIRLHLQAIDYFAPMENRRVTSWVRLLCRAATENSDIQELLLRFTSLVWPPDDVMEELEFMVATLRCVLGPLPVTEEALKKDPHKYLSWLHLVLTEFQSAQGTPYAPKLFSLLPQTSHHQSFIKISTTGLHKLLRAAGTPNVPNFSTKGCQEFTSRSKHWWGTFTKCISFGTQSARSKRRFYDEVQTDGVSVSVTMFKPDPPSSASAQPPSRGKKRKRQEQTTTEWVRGLSDSTIGQAPRILGLDPGRKALFTAAIHSQSAADSLTAQRSHSSKYTTMSWSIGKWRQASGINYRLHKTSLWLNRKPALKAALQATPSAKVACSDLFMEHIKHRMEHEAAAASHFGDKRHKKLRWRTFIKRQQAYSSICKDISAGSADTVVAYGDAAFSSSSGKGNPSTPTVSLRRKLGHHCKVFDIDEFRTSRLCCACKTAMDGMPLPLTGDLLPYE
ncbi:hypothetical protein ABBQ38_012549 [Trebouxia sp. C0009 RCD-2024]